MLMEAKKFSDVALHSITKCCRTNFFLDYNPQSVKRVFILLDKEHKVPGGLSPPTFHHPSEILRLSDPLLVCKPEGSFHGDPPYYHLSVK